MKRSDLMRHLENHGAVILRDGGKHTIYFNPKNETTTSIPRHTEIKKILAKKSCADLEIPPPV